MLDLYYSKSDYCIDYSHTTTENPQNMDFHLHDRFEIYLFISGKVKYFIENKVYSLKYGDILIMNSHEIHKPFFVSDCIYERIVIHFDPMIAKLFSQPELDLLNCFIYRPKGEQNKINLTKDQLNEVLNLLMKIEKANNDSISMPEARTLKLLYFIELLIRLNSIFTNSLHHAAQPGMPDILVAIIGYIDQNLCGDLSLSVFEEKFFINRFYLSRLFKKNTGSGLHEYILYKRISLAKKLLAEGYNVTSTASLCGFNDYSNFLRTFKKAVGITPGRYHKTISLKL